MARETREAVEVDPADVRELGQPRVGYIGSMDPHTFDGDLLVQVARQMPEVTFVLVGPCALPDSTWGEVRNVHRLGQKPYEQVASYMAACDVLIMPWNRNEWIKACNPVKLKEYLAVGRPIVTTPFDELRRYEGLAHIACDAESFAQSIRSALAEPKASPEINRRRDRVRHESWTGKASSVLLELKSRGIECDQRLERGGKRFSGMEKDFSRVGAVTEAA
jgi:glycosyltransferase involved in cell wall biosynthesis